MKQLLLTGLLVVAALALSPAGQMRVAPLDEQQGHVALGLALRHLGNTGTYMMFTAHPDDEDNGLFVKLNRGEGYRTTLVTATRGNGGQNEIGPELFEALGVLRTEELTALHRFDGAEQYFTRAVDFGFSFSIEETLEKWGRDEITGDFVRLLRTIRPEVVAAMTPTGTGGGLHHQTSAMLAHDAFRMAADPTKYPEQIQAGLRPWQPKKFYFRTGFGGTPPAAGRVTRCDLGAFDPLLGKTYADVGTESRSMHKCQGQAQLLALPGPAASTYELAESTIPGAMDRDEKALFDGIDTSIAGLATLAGARAPKELVEGLAAIASNVQAARKNYDSVGDEAALQPLFAGLHAVRALRGQLRAMGPLGPAGLDEAARFDIDVRLGQKEREFQQAALIANGVRIEALSDDGVVVPGQPVKVSVIVAVHGGADLNVTQVKFDGFERDAPCALTPVMAAASGGGRGGRGAAPAGPAVSTFRRSQVGRCEPTLMIPADARVSEPYWHREGTAGRYTFDAGAPFGLPYRPTPFSVQITMTFGVPGSLGTEEVVGSVPVQYRYEGNIFSGEKRTELLVVPALSVRVSPDVVIIPAALASLGSLRSLGSSSGPAPALTGARPARGAIPVRGPGASREVRVTVVNDTTGPVDSVVTLEVPEGWTASPADQAVGFSRQDEAQTVRFQVRPGPNTRPGRFTVRAIVSVASMGGRTFDRGFQIIEYPHIRRQHIFDAAVTAVQVIDVKTTPNLTVGYVMGVGDQVPPALEQLGVKVEMISPDDLAWGNLSRFDTIITGVRAYERREDLRANNRRLLEYVQGGGTVIVQYNKFEFNQAQYGPYPAQVSSNRITDEFAPVELLERANPIFTTPNPITDAAWKGWVQERGLYFLGEKDSRYHDLVELEDPFPNNKGEKRGALVEAAYGKGRWIYVGLGLWRELPAGVPGAYQLLANLVSLGKAPASPSSPRLSQPAKKQ